MRASLVQVFVCAAVGGVALTAAANPSGVVQHDCTISVYTSAKRQLEQRRARGEPVTDEAFAAASGARILLPDKGWRGTMVWRDGTERDYAFRDGKLVLSGWFNGAGDIMWTKREAVPIGFRVGTDARGYGGTPIEQWLPAEVTFFKIEITDPWHVPSEGAARGRFSSVESGPVRARRADPQREAPPPESAGAWDRAREGAAGGAGIGILGGGLAGGTGVTTAGEVITVGSGLFAAAKAIIASAVAAGAAAGAASVTTDAATDLAEKGLEWLGDGVDAARDLVRKRVLRDGTDRARSAAEQLTKDRDFQALPAPVQERLLQNMTGHIRQRALEALGEHLQRMIEHTDANIGRLAELAADPNNQAARAGLAALERDRAMYQLILDEQQRALAQHAPIELALREAPPTWRAYAKHLPSRQLLAQSPAAFAEATRGRPALYLQPEQVQQLETAAWERGVTTRAGNTEYRLWRFDDIIGASDGELTRCIRVEVTAGVLHGHPVPDRECDGVPGGVR